MAEPTTPAGEPPADALRFDAPRPRADAPAVPSEERPADRAPDEEVGRDRDADGDALQPGSPTVAQPAVVQAAAVPAAPSTAVEPPPPAPAEQPVLAPAADFAPPPPRKQGNRLAATAWVLLAAGLFQVVFFGVNALVALVFGGSQAVVPQLRSLAPTVLAWLPVLLFFLLFELTVLLINRAGRVAYVLASLIVGLIVYVLTVVLFSLISVNGLGDANRLSQTFLNWEFILVGLVAREVMLWTGLAIGSRGIRVRRRNREARRTYREEVAGARD